MDWVLENIRKDDEDEFIKFKDIFDVLKPWLNLNLYSQEQKHLKTEAVDKSDFERELMKHGMDEKEAKSIIKDKIQIDSIENELERELNGR